jgi:lipopolysaccharide transport system ATP-binding protein
MIGHAPKQYYREFSALNNVSFEVRKGETVGIIGRNGSGKSTLLQIICGTLTPTGGTVETRGRIAALLELGSGFNPEFTGRENVYLNAAVLGLSPTEIDERYDKIAGFADIGQFIEHPIKTYSSGMAVRLAFAVAISVDPQILVVDEALAVGDAAFQRKCIRRIQELTDSGVTRLFVSHDSETVKKLCDRALFIKEGRAAHFGVAKQVCDEYEKYLFGDQHKSPHPVADSSAGPNVETAKFDPSLVASCEMRYGNGKADIFACWLEATNGQRINVVEAGTPFRWTYRVRFNEDVDRPIFAMMLKTLEGVSLYGTDTTALQSAPSYVCAGEELEASFTLVNVLAPGIYYLNCGVRLQTAGEDEFLSRRVDCAILRITPSSSTSVLNGLVEMDAQLSVTPSVISVA